MPLSRSQRILAYEIAIIGVVILIIWLVLMVAYGTINPFYVVASGSMVPALEVHDLLVISARVPFDEVVQGDIIVFDKPSDHKHVIVHRVVEILGEEPWTLRAQGDANPVSIPGTDFPITEEEYRGVVVHIVPQLGILPELIQPPVNYIILAGAIGYIVFKWAVSHGYILHKSSGKSGLVQKPEK